MKSTEYGTIVDESFNLDLGDGSKDFKRKHVNKYDSVIFELFLSDCKDSIVFFLNLKEPITLGSDYKERLRDINKYSTDLHSALNRLPIDCADCLNAESLRFEKELASFSDDLMEYLLLLQKISEASLEKLNLKPGKDKDSIKRLMGQIIKAYTNRFNKPPCLTKNETALYGFINNTIASAINEQIGFDLYRDVLKKSRGI